MADYYIKMSVLWPLSPERLQRALSLYKQCSAARCEGEDPAKLPEELQHEDLTFSFDCEEQDGSLWIHGSDDVESAAAFIQFLLKEWDDPGTVAFAYSLDCSKPRTDAFGGGAVIITKDSSDWMGTSQWLMDKLKGVECQNAGF